MTVRQILLIITILIFFSGCKTIDQVRDKRGTQGCYVFSDAAQLEYITLDGNLTKTAVWCSENLPDKFKFHYNDGRLKVEIN